MGVRYPGFERCGERPAETGGGRVEGRRRGNESRGSNPPFVRKEYEKWWQTRFCSEDRHWSRPETVGDPSLHRAPMDLHLVEKAFGGGKQVGTIREDREHQTVGKSLAHMGRESLTRIREASYGGEGGLR